VPSTSGACVTGGDALTATETPSAVTLILWQIVTNGVCPADIGFGTAAVTLRQPLGGRPLVDGTNGRHIPYFDGRKLLQVTNLPPGYRFSAYGLFPGTGTRYNGWEREYISSAPAAAPLDVGQAPERGTVYPPWPSTSPAAVNGRPATAAVLLSGSGQVYGRAITWRADGYSLVVYSAAVQAGQVPVPAADLARVAAGLRP